MEISKLDTDTIVDTDEQKTHIIESFLATSRDTESNTSIYVMATLFDSYDIAKDFFISNNPNGEEGVIENDDGLSYSFDTDSEKVESSVTKDGLVIIKETMILK